MSKIGVYLGQKFSFFNFMMRGERSTSVFFPGCAFMKLGSEIIYKTFMLLKNYDREAKVCSLCCSYPSQILNESIKVKNENKLIKYLLDRRVRIIYLACPNCYNTLKKIFDDNNIDIELIMIYKVLENSITNGKRFNAINEKVVIHDPCVIRDDVETQESVRSILRCIGQEYVEPKFTKKNTVCCGNIKMLHVVNERKSEIIRNNRLNDLTNSADTICSYCNGCLTSFSKAGAKTIHIIELIFGKAKSNRFINRVMFTLGLKKC